MGFGFLPLATAAPSIGTNFTGTNRVAGGINPPDTMGAVGPNHIAEMLNGRVSVYNKSTGETVASQSHDAFWIQAGAPPVSFAFDPRIVYDVDSGRWFATAVDNMRGENHLLVAVSSNDDPTGQWNGFSLPSDPSGAGVWADFPTLGLDGSGVYISASLLRTGQTQLVSSSIWVFPKSDLLATPPTVDRRSLFDGLVGYGAAMQVSFDPRGGTSAPTILSTTSPVPTVGVLGLNIAGGSLEPRLTDPEFVGVQSVLPPPLAPQPAIGGSQKQGIFAGNSRFTSNVVRGAGGLWAAQTVDHDGRAAIRWFEINEQDFSVRQEGIISHQELSLFYPSIAVNEFGDVVVGMNGSSPTHPVSSFAVVGDSIGGRTTFGEPILLKAGVDDYERLDSQGRNRWGDYSATVVDPSDPKSFWTFQQFVSGDNEWAIQITQILVDGSTPQAGDTNGDGAVDRADVAALATHFGLTGDATLADGDFNGDRSVNLLDVAVQQANLGPATPIDAVPEPASVVAAAGMALFLLTRGRPSRAARGGWLFGRACGWRPGRPRRFGGRR